MQREPKGGLGDRLPYAFPVHGRVRPEELLRRKIMQKMQARRQRRLAGDAVLGRRAI